MIKMEVNDLGQELLIQLECEHPKRLYEIEQHLFPIDKNIFACPATILVKNRLSAYFFNQRYTHKTFQQDIRWDWMELIYQLNAEFAKLEHLMNRPISLRSLTGQLQEFQHEIERCCQTISDPRLKSLSQSFCRNLAKDIHDFIIQAQDADLRNIYAQHDMSFKHKSLGRLIHTELYACLDMAIKGAEYLTPHPWKNLILRDEAILELATAQDQIYELAFSFQGIAKTNPFHPYSHSVLRRFHPRQAHKIVYQLPKYHLFLTEYWLANFYNIPLKTFQSSNHPELICLQFLVFPYELVLMILVILSKIFIILPLYLWSMEKSQKLNSKVYLMHTNLSIYQRLENLKNQGLAKKWINLPSEARALLLSQLNPHNLFCFLPELLFHLIKKTSFTSLNKLQFNELLIKLSQLDLPQKIVTLDRIEPEICNPLNQFITAFDSIETICLVLGQNNVLPLFRQHPLLASLNFILSSFTWISLNGGLMSLKLLDPILTLSQNLMINLGQAYFGQAISQHLFPSMAACFLYWQLSLLGFQVSTRLLSKKEQLWRQSFSSSPDKLSLGFTLFVLSGYFEAFFPSLPTQIYLSPKLSLFNFIFAFTNFLHQEAEKCLKGTPPFNILSLAVLGLKSSVFFYNLLQTNTCPQLENANNYPDLKAKENQPSILTILLNGLVSKNLELQQALKDKSLAKTYFLKLAEAFKNHAPDPTHQIFLQQFYRLYCHTRVFNLLRVFNIIFLPLHAIEWAYGAHQQDLFHRYSGQTKLAEDFYLIFQLIYALAYPLLLGLRLLNNFIILAALRMPIFCLRQLITLPSIQLKLMNIDDQLRKLFLHDLLIYLLRPLQVLHAKLAFHSGFYADLGAQAEIILDQVLCAETQLESGLKIGFCRK